MPDTYIFLIILCFVFFLSFFLLRKFCCCNFDPYNKIMPPYTILMVKNNEDCIEGILRFIISKKHQQRNYSEKLVIVDMGSCDHTVSIAESFCRKYDFIYIITLDEYIAAISNA